MKASKWLITIIFVVCCFGFVFVAWGIEVLSLKVDGVDKEKVVQGVITKIEGNKITLKDTSGKLLTVGVKGLGDVKRESSSDKDKAERYNLGGFHVGDRVKIQGGNLTKFTEAEWTIKPKADQHIPKIDQKK